MLVETVAAELAELAARVSLPLIDASATTIVPDALAIPFMIGSIVESRILASL